MFSFEAKRPEYRETNVGRRSYKWWEEDWKHLLAAELQCETKVFLFDISVLVFFLLAQNCSQKKAD